MKRFFTLAALIAGIALSTQAQKRYVMLGSEGKDAKAVCVDDIQQINFSDNAASIVKNDGSTVVSDMTQMTTPTLSLKEYTVEEVDTATYRTMLMNSRKYQVRLTNGWSEDLYVSDAKYKTVRLWHETGLESSEGTSMKFWVLTYNDDLTRVENIKQLSVVNNEEEFKDEWISEYEFVFNYDENGRLTGVKNGTRDIVKNVVYNEAGLIDTYSACVPGTRTFTDYKAQYAIINGCVERIDCMDSGSNFIVGSKMLPNRNYIEGLPAVIPGSVSGISLYHIYNKYMYDGVEGMPVTWGEGTFRNGLNKYNTWETNFKANDISWTIQYVQEK